MPELTEHESCRGTGVDETFENSALGQARLSARARGDEGGDIDSTRELTEYES